MNEMLKRGVSLLGAKIHLTSSVGGRAALLDPRTIASAAAATSSGKIEH
jgi:hypothetical protein